MIPAEGLIAVPENTIALGVPKLEWLSALKNSARNCKRTCSEMLVFLNSERSSSVRPGPL